MNWLIEMISYPFMQRALIVGILMSFCAALVGVTVVLKKNSMIGDGLSHVAFGAFAIASVLGLTPLWVALPIVILASFGILFLSGRRKIDGDAIIAVLSASGLAIGVMAISAFRGVNIDLNSYLFGSILSVGWEDVVLSVVVALAVGIIYVVMYNRIFLVTFDVEFAKSLGLKTNIYDAVFAIICSVVIVLGMRLLGALLISSLMIFPVLIAMTFNKSFKKVVIWSVMISVVDFLIGLLFSYFISLPVGATVVVVNLLILVIVRLARWGFRG